MNLIQFNDNTFNNVSYPLPWVIFRIAWQKIFNPDIEGFNIYVADMPYSTFSFLYSTSHLVGLVSILKGQKKWIKVVPYTSRGELTPVVIKTVKGV